MPKIFEQFCKEILSGENIDAYLTVFVAVVLSLLNLTGIISKPSTVQAVTLSVLATITIALLVVRRRVDVLSAKLSEDMQNVLRRQFPDDIQDRISKATDIWIIGVSLNSFMRNYYSLFERKIKRGKCTIRVVVRDPNGSTVHLIAKNSFDNVAIAHVQGSIAATIERLQKLQGLAPKCLSYKTLDHPIVMNIFAFDPDSVHGVLYVEHHLFKNEEGSVPKLVLTHKDGTWYETYRKQLQAYWDNATSPTAAQQTQALPSTHSPAQPAAAQQVSVGQGQKTI